MEYTKGEKERLVYQPSCGCKVYRIMRSNPNLYRIQYCPNHEAAPDLYEACKSALSKGDNDARVPGYILDELREAIAKAEGD